MKQIVVQYQAGILLLSSVVEDVKANSLDFEKLGRNKIEPITLSLIGLPKKGTYVVKEEVVKAPLYDHPCNLTTTAIKINFPEMKSEMFVNLLGYKGSNMISLKRCKGSCSESSSPVSCMPTKIREKKVKMTVSSFLTGETPREQLKELILDDHLECGCQCSSLLAKECAGRFNPTNCACECPMVEFGDKKLMCERGRDHYWDTNHCKCVSKTVATRGVELIPSRCGLEMTDVVRDILKQNSSESTSNIIAWVLLGASLTSVIVLTFLTLHYRRKVKKMNSEKFGREENSKEESVQQIYKEELIQERKSFGSLHSLQNCLDFHEQMCDKEIRTPSSRSCENLLQGMPSTQHVEIGGEFFRQPFKI